MQTGKLYITTILWLLHIFIFQLQYYATYLSNRDSKYITLQLGFSLLRRKKNDIRESKM